MGLDKLVDSDMNVTSSEIKKAYRKGVTGRSHNVSKVGTAKEAETMEAIKATLRIFGGWYVRVEAGGVLRHTQGGGVLTPSQMAGVPDWIWLHPEFGFWGIEAKAEKGGRIESHQIDHLKRIIAAGGQGVIIQSLTGLHEAISEFRKEGRLNGRKKISEIPLF